MLTLSFAAEMKTKAGVPPPVHAISETEGADVAYLRAEKLILSPAKQGFVNKHDHSAIGRRDHS